VSVAAARMNYELPWTSSAGNSKFRTLLGICLAIYILFGVLVPWITIPPVVHEQFKSAPPPLAHIVLERPPIVIPPPPPDVLREPVPQPEAKKEKPPEVKKPVPLLNKPVVAEPTVADAREKAAVSGLLQFKDSFADMRDAVDVGKLNDTGAIRRGTGDAAMLDRRVVQHDAVAEGHDAGAVLGNVHLMRHDQDGEIALDVEPLKDAHHLDARPRIEVPGRFIGEQQDRTIDQRAGNCHALLLPAGHLTALVVHPIGEADGLQCRQRAAPACRRGNPRVIQQWQFDVLEGRRPGQQVEALEDEANFVIPHERELIPGESGNIAAVEAVFAARRTIQASQDVHQRRLSGA